MFKNKISSFFGWPKKIQRNQEPVVDSNSQSNIQSNIVESPNLKKAISKYSEVPENLDLNRDMSALTKVLFIFFFLK